MGYGSPLDNLNLLFIRVFSFFTFKYIIHSIPYFISLNFNFARLFLLRSFKVNGLILMQNEYDRSRYYRLKSPF